MTDTITTVLISACTLIVLPWLAWVTSSIFNLKQQTALLKAELKVLDKIQDLLEKRI